MSFKKGEVFFWVSQLSQSYTIYPSSASDTIFKPMLFVVLDKIITCYYAYWKSWYFCMEVIYPSNNLHINSKTDWALLTPQSNGLLSRPISLQSKHSHICAHLAHSAESTAMATVLGGWSCHQGSSCTYELRDDGHNLKRKEWLSSLSNTMMQTMAPKICSGKKKYFQRVSPGEKKS